jgi:Ni,Fe-hydrogenase III small subunit
MAVEIYGLETQQLSKNMREALERTYRAPPDPKWVVAVGDCAFDGGIFAGSYAVVGGVASVTQLLQGLLALLQQAQGRPPAC